MDFYILATDNSVKKVLPVTLPFGLFPRLQWKVTFFYSYSGNPTHLAHSPKEKPSNMDPTFKKRVLRTSTYGLYAVSCADEGEVNIFPPNWLTQVAFDPPLLT